MSFNGSGQFLLNSGGLPYVTGTTISSTHANNLNTDLASGLSNVICKDGQTTVTANLPMATFRHTNVGAATARTDYARASQVQDSTLVLIGTVAGTNTITGSLSPAITAYAAGQFYTFIPANTNTGATTININSVGARNVFAGGTACVGGELVAGIPTVIEDDGTRFHIVNSAPFGDARPLVMGTTDNTKRIRVEVDGLTTATTRVVTAPDRDITLNLLPPLTNSLSGDVVLNNTANYFDGPTVAQGTAGVWFASGTVTVNDTAGSADFDVKLWDGTTVIASCETQTNGANQKMSVSLSGYLSAPAGDIRISVKDKSSTSGNIKFNLSGNSKDSTISVFRIG